MSMPSIVDLVVVALVIVLMFLVPAIARLIFRLMWFLIPAAVALAGIAMIMNDETIFERPGPEQRVVRFLTMKSAAASESGSGSVTCEMGNQPQAAATAAAGGPKRRAEQGPSEFAPSRTRLKPGVGPEEIEDVYPELIRRSYPGIPREKLFKLSADAVDSLGGWRIVKGDPGGGTIDCVYASRIFKIEDDVRIKVGPAGGIDVCARSGLARPDQTSILRYLPGDLGASVGHIKQFYEALDPLVDKAYKEEQEKQNAKPPH